MSPLCPCCKQVKETFEHLLSCPSLTITVHGEASIQELVKGKGPCPNFWLPTSRWHATHHSFPWANCNIGWYQLFMSRISKNWDKALLSYNTKPGFRILNNMCSSQAITLFWKFIRSIWMHQSLVFHGADAQELAAIILRDSQEQLKTLYEEIEHPWPITPFWGFGMQCSGAQSSIRRNLIIEELFPSWGQHGYYPLHKEHNSVQSFYFIPRLRIRYWKHLLPLQPPWWMTFLSPLLILLKLEYPSKLTCHNLLTLLSSV
jgi:hypothetical protein